MKLLWISIAVLFVLGPSLTAAEPLDILSEESRYTIRSPLGEDELGLLDIREGLDVALAEQNPQSLAQYVLCALSDGDKVAVDVRGKSVSRARVLSSQGCASETRGLVLLQRRHVERKNKRGKASPVPHAGVAVPGGRHLHPTSPLPRPIGKETARTRPTACPFPHAALWYAARGRKRVRTTTLRRKSYAAVSRRNLLESGSYR